MVEPHELLVADSFRAAFRGGQTRVRGLSRHLARFRTSVERATACITDAALHQQDRLHHRVEAFLDESLREIAAFGDGFPRLELRMDAGGGRPVLHLTLRPLPALGDTVELRTAGPLELSYPDMKGPNIARLSAVNASLGAEALITDATGWVREGATTSLIWWDGEQGRVAPQGERVPSITEALIVGDASIRGEPLLPTQATVSEISQHEVWAVNALHGIRSVTRIDRVELPRPDLDRLQRFREAHDATWEPVSEG